MEVEFWFELGSTYSYPAAIRIESVAKQYSRTIIWKPFLLGPLFREQGWNDSPFNLYPAKGRYMWRDLERLCAEYRIPFAKPTTFPRNGLLASRVACMGADELWLPSFVRNVYTANFARDLDISKPEIVRNCLEGWVSDPDALLKQAESKECKDRLRHNTAEAVTRGIFGAPSFLVGSELFWGNDRMEAAMQWENRERSISRN